MIAPYGSWPSPISAQLVAAGGVRLSFPAAVPGPDGTEVWWTEGRPAEGGRQTVLRQAADGTVSQLLPAPWNARSRVHEYGGVSWVAFDGGVIFVEFTDQRLYLLPAGATEPSPLTGEPAEPAGWRYADLQLVGRQVWCVREQHERGRVSRALVAVPTDGSGQVRELVAGSDFLAHPRRSPDGRQLAWIAWDHPRMPWDGTELRVAPIDAEGRVGPARTVLGGPQEAVLQPEWADDQRLFAVTDATGWWNLVALAADGSGAARRLHPAEQEFGAPLWQLGQRTYAVLADGRLAVVHGTGSYALGLLDPASGQLTDLDLPYPAWAPSLHAHGDLLVAIAGSPVEPTSVLAVSLGTGQARVVRRAADLTLDPAYLPVPTVERFPRPDGSVVHALVYPPTHPQARPPADERAPYVAFVHGGPTAHVTATLDLEKAYFTSRGIGVVDVNYGGSSGYGRAYRELLREQWGVLDVADCVSAVRALAAAGRADPDRLAIRGGSAGGWTVLAALTGTDTFAAGTSYYGVAELLRMAADTHDFESRYLDGLIGPLPATRDRYVERAPLSHVDALSCPVLLLQGEQDEVVPPSQAELFRDALVAKGIPHAYLLFAGEQHGFRKAETVVAALHAELSFYGQVLGFEPPGIPRLELVTGR